MRENFLNCIGFSLLKSLLIRIVSLFPINSIIIHYYQLMLEKIKVNIMERSPAKLSDRVRYRIRVMGYSIRTEHADLGSAGGAG